MINNQAMNKPLDLIDRLPPLDPLGTNVMADHVVPILFLHADSFERWVLQRNYELKRPPLSSDELQELRKAWGK